MARRQRFPPATRDGIAAQTDSRNEMNLPFAIRPTCRAGARFWRTAPPPSHRPSGSSFNSTGGFGPRFRIDVTTTWPVINPP